MYEDREYIISDICRVKTHANIDDSVMHWTLNLRDGGNGNIKRWLLDWAENIWEKTRVNGIIFAD